jgi:hypothetical protein
MRHQCRGTAQKAGRARGGPSAVGHLVGQRPEGESKSHRTSCQRCSTQRRVALCCSALPCVAAHCPVLQRVVLCCSALSCVAAAALPPTVSARRDIPLLHESARCTPTGTHRLEPSGRAVTRPTDVQAGSWRSRTAAACHQPRHSRVKRDARSRKASGRRLRQTRVPWVRAVRAPVHLSIGRHVMLPQLDSHSDIASGRAEVREVTPL